MRIVITGVAGFIGSNLADFLLERNHQIIGIDNFSTGQERFVSKACKNNLFTLIKEDIDQLNVNSSCFKDVDTIIHLAANADVRFGPNHPKRDLKENTINTSTMLEVARINNIPKFIFSSTGSVYGEHDQVPTKENASFPIQTSLYGASKLAGEGLITAYSYAYGLESYIFRFVSILGPRYSHGHVVDFYNQLIKNNQTLKILGDGNQTKSYLHVKDCIRAIYMALSKDDKSKHVNIFNIGTPETITVTNSAMFIAENMNLKPKFEYSGGSQGWIGDNPLIHLCCNKIKKELGWKPEYTIKESLQDTVNYLKSNFKNK
tara:strand:+ start:3593 stop:4546 length:954 start_codon:yes stop_codon:yes gene_type:complete